MSTVTLKFLASGALAVTTLLGVGLAANAAGEAPSLAPGATTTTTAPPTTTTSTTTTVQKWASTTVIAEYVDEHGAVLGNGGFDFYVAELDPNHPDHGNPVLGGAQSVNITRSQQAQIHATFIPTGYRLLDPMQKNHDWTGNKQDTVQFRVTPVTAAGDESQVSVPMDEPEEMVSVAAPQPAPAPEPEPQPQPQPEPQSEPEPQPQPEPEPQPQPEPEPEPEPVEAEETEETEPVTDEEAERELEHERADDGGEFVECEYDQTTGTWYCPE